MAGSWEPLIYRVRRDDISNAEHKITPQQMKLYKQEHSQQMVDELKKLGVNFVMTHCYKAFGLNAEKQGMEDAAKFSALCHDNGVRTGCYVFSGTLGWEILRKEAPESKDWELLDAEGQPIPYPGKPYRHFFNRNNPGVQNYLHKVVDFAINDMNVDLLHMDNYTYAVGFDRVSIERFRKYLKRYYKPSDLGVQDFETIMPPKEPDQNTEIGRAWIDFGSQSMAEAYYDMSKYARSVRPNILMEINTCQFGDRITVPTDHGRCFRYGEAFWDEGVEPAYKDGQFETRQIVYKTGQTMDNLVFVYIRNPLQAAESLTYNTDCLGCICQFEYAKITVPSGDPLVQSVSPELLPYVRFFHEQRPYYRNAARMPDIAVLRSFPSQRYCPDTAWQTTSRFEQYCIANSIPWALIFDQNLASLSKYRALCLVGANALSDKQVDQIRKYAKSGGGLVLTEETGRYDERMKERASNPFSDLAGSKVVRVKADAGKEEAIAAMKTASGGSFSVSVSAAPSVVTEMTEQTKEKRRLIHLINYSPDTPVDNATVDISVPSGWKVKRVVMMTPASPTPMPISFRRDRDRITLQVPRLDVYGLISVETR